MNISASNFKNWETLPLADPDFYKANEIDVLIGIDHFFNVLIEGQIKSDQNEPVLQNTVFGWIVAGAHVQQNPNKYESIFGFTTNIDENNIDFTLNRFWELELIPNDVSLLSPDEELCEASFTENLQRTSGGRFQVRLPFKKSTSELGKSLTMAIQRLKGMERRFLRDDEFYNLYKEFMNEYLALGHMQEIPQPSVQEASFFLPHGSAKTTSGVSLNDCLAVGPTVQSTLYAIILRFREYRYIFSADIEKMYRQVRVHEDDTKFQQIVWREGPTHPIRYFKLTTVTYGLASAPYLATRCVKQIAQAILTSYSGADTLDEIKNLKKSIITSLSTYGFNLRKWVSNSREVLNDIPPADRGHQIKPIDDVSDKTVKILGLQYDPLDDLFEFRVEMPKNLQFTKRTILSEAGKIFDPIGWIAPINIKIKIFIQQLWLLNLNWDEPLPEKEIDEWRRMRSTLPDIQEIKIPRFVHTNKNSLTELHGFCDASQMAYAAVIYYRVTTEDGDSYIHLITAKTKVAPIKQQSLPRLELCGALLLTNLMNLVRKETNSNVQTIFLWTDSIIVLDWLSSHPRRWPTFIANRTSQIISSFNRTHWRHVPSADNPADIASRGCFPNELKDSTLWWNGPDWLHGHPSVWPPQQRYYDNLEDGCLNSISHTAVIENDILDQLITSFSTFHKIQRVVAYILRFINNCKKESFRNVDFFLSGKEMYDALFKLCGYDQNKYFQNELADLRNAKPIRKTSALKSLNPFVDEFGLLRVGGRLEKCDVPLSTRHPIILSAKSLLT